MTIFHFIQILVLKTKLTLNSNLNILSNFVSQVNVSSQMFRCFHWNSSCENTVSIKILHLSPFRKILPFMLTNEPFSSCTIISSRFHRALFNTSLCFPQCSAGVGRTGVFITLSIVLERMRYEGVVDIFQTVKMLRTQRPAMVQTEVRVQRFSFREDCLV